MSEQMLDRRFGAGMMRGCLLILVVLFCGEGFAATPASISAARQVKLAELTGQLRLGSEYFLNRTDTKAYVEKQFEAMHATGLTLVRIFVIWDDVERVPGVWDFSHYDWIYDAAAKNGIQIAATLCPEDPPGWAGKTTFYHNRVNLNDPANRAAAEVYLRKVVERYKNNRAQGAWLLMNEPAKYDTEPTTFHAFGDWLQAKYGTVGNLNGVWFRPLKWFSDVTITDAQLENYWTDYNAVIDWRAFNVDNLINQLEWVRQQVLAIDPNHPVHFNVTRPIGDAAGQDAWKEKKIQDIVGVSMHWTMERTTPEKDYGERYAYRLDVMAGTSVAQPEKPLWVTELQGGPVAYTGGFALTETPGDLTRWVWDAYGAGTRAVIFWLWNPRVSGTEAGEWSLVSLDGTESVRVPAVKAIADTLQKNPWLNEAHPQAAKVAILYNREAQVLISLDGRSQHREEEVEDSLRGCYLALHRAHVPTDFVDLGQLKSGELQKYDVLYIPYSYALDDAAIAALKTYVRQGGTLWADGLTGWKNATGTIRPTIPGGMTDLFGVEATDLYPVQPDQPYSVTAEKEEGGELWRLPLELKGAEVVLRTPDGQPFEVKHSFGKGQAYYFESAVSLAYDLRFNPIVQQWIVAPSMAETNLEQVSLTQGSREIMFRGMVQPDGLAAILTNWGDAQKAVVGFLGDYKVVDTMTGETVPVAEENGRTLATVNVKAGAVTILKATKIK
ncbi:MAG: beta-galactosidase [Acidobacteriaceae bacterium]